MWGRFVGWIRRGVRFEIDVGAADRREHERQRLLEETVRVEAMIAGLQAKARLVLRQEGEPRVRK